LIIISIAIILTLIADMIPNWKSIITFRWLSYIFADPYYFRVQIAMFLPFMLFSISVDIFTLSKSFEYKSIVESHDTVVILNTIVIGILFIIDVVFPIIVTMIRLGVHLIKKKDSSKESMEALISRPDIAPLFIAFCEKEYSMENILCYNDILAYKDANMDKAKGIYDTYLQGKGAVMEVNIPTRVAAAVFERIQKNEIDSTLFDHVKRDIVTNLSDTWSRYVTSQEYEDLLRVQRQEKELLDSKVHILIAM
jgi:hypothetical protein